MAALECEVAPRCFAAIGQSMFRFFSLKLFRRNNRFAIEGKYCWPAMERQRQPVTMTDFPWISKPTHPRSQTIRLFLEKKCSNQTTIWQCTAMNVEILFNCLEFVDEVRDRFACCVSSWNRNSVQDGLSKLSIKWWHRRPLGVSFISIGAFVALVVVPNSTEATLAMLPPQEECTPE